MGATFVDIGAIRLYHGDALEILSTLGPVADLVVTDWPYRLTSGGPKGEMGGAFSAENYDNGGALFDIVEWADGADLLFAACKTDARAYVMTSDREECAARRALMQAGFGFHRLLVWWKMTATPNRYYMPDCEFALYLYKGRTRRLRDCGAKQLIRCNQVDVTLHPTEKPVAMMQMWIENSARTDELVLDPFMGTGTTLVAAARSGRPGIGIEKDARWFDVACARVEAALCQPSLFAESGAA